MKILGIYDNGGKTFDRYTVVYSEVVSTTILPRVIGVRPYKKFIRYEARGMSANPFHPQGVGQMTTASRGKHLGKIIKFSDLPKDCQKLIRQDLGEE